LGLSTPLFSCSCRNSASLVPAVAWESERLHTGSLTSEYETSVFCMLVISGGDPAHRSPKEATWTESQQLCFSITWEFIQNSFFRPHTNQLNHSICLWGSGKYSVRLLRSTICSKGRELLG
jgi:hypothetical protein